MSVVYRDGDIVGVFFRASTLPDRIELHDTVAEGTYKFEVEIHMTVGVCRDLTFSRLFFQKTCYV